MVTFGKIGVDGQVLHHVGVLIEDGDLVGGDVLVDVVEEEGVVPVDQLGLVLLDVLLGQQEDLAREVEPLLVGLDEVALGGLRELLKLLLVVFDDHAQLAVVLLDVLDLQRVAAVLLAVLARGVDAAERAVVDLLQLAHLPHLVALREAVGALQVAAQRLHHLVPHARDPLLREHRGQRLVLLRLGHVGQREEVEELVGVREVCALGVEVPAEGLHAGLVDRCLLLEEGVDAVDAEVDVELELQPLGGLLGTVEEPRGLLEELLAQPAVEQLQDVVPVELGLELRLVEHLGPQVGLLVLEHLVGAHEAGELQVLLDQRQQLLLLVLEVVGVCLVLLVGCGDGHSLVYFCGFFVVVDVGRRRLGRFLIHRGYC